jgi:tRNA(Ile2) C34 agmatinyltransferase TiaS
MELINERVNNMIRSEMEIFCPFCGSNQNLVKTNGNGYYRCKGLCKREFFVSFILEV